MRVLMVSKGLILGAYQRKLEEIAARGVDLTVIVPPYWRDDAGRKTPLERMHTTGYRMIVDPAVFNGHFHYHFYPRLGRRMREVRPDILHMDEEPYNLATAHAFWLANHHGARPIFFTWQNLDRRYPPPFSWMEHYCYRHAAGAIAGNAEAVDVLRAKGYDGPTWIIPQVGVDTQIFRRDENVAAEERPFTVGWCSGRLRPGKAVHLLVEAVARLHDETRLEILGWGPEERRIRTLAAELGLGDRFRVHPPLPSYRVPEFINRMDVVAMTSISLPNWKEQFGRILMEAMACEVPVVGSNSGEVKHVIGDAGLTFPEGDVGALAACLRQLRDSAELRRSLAAKGLARVKALYTPEQLAAQTVQAYEDVMSAGNG